MMTRLAVWIARGCGLGHIPFAPGTFGSIGGLAWCLALLALPTPYPFIAGSLLGIVVSVITSSIAENYLSEKDPGSVVIDEIAALPVCLFGWLAIAYFADGEWLGPRVFFDADAWPKLTAVFLLFRFFDVLKPWPIRQVQRLPGGWGITVDDLLAAVYVNLCVMGFIWVERIGAAHN